MPFLIKKSKKIESYNNNAFIYNIDFQIYTRVLKLFPSEVNNKKTLCALCDSVVKTNTTDQPTVRQGQGKHRENP